MINGLICKMFHKKEVCVEDVVRGVFVSVVEVLNYNAQLINTILAPIYVGYCILYEQPLNTDQKLFVAGAAFATCASYAVILWGVYAKHSTDIIAICPNVHPVEEKKE